MYRRMDSGSEELVLSEQNQAMRRNGEQDGMNEGKGISMAV